MGTLWLLPKELQFWICHSPGPEPGYIPAQLLSLPLLSHIWLALLGFLVAFWFFCPRLAYPLLLARSAMQVTFVPIGRTVLDRESFESLSLGAQAWSWAVLWALSDNCPLAGEGSPNAAGTGHHSFALPWFLFASLLHLFDFCGGR